MIQKQMIDTVVDEIHQTRRQMSEKFSGDFVAILDDARRRQLESGRPIWKPNATNKTMHPSGGTTVTGMENSAPAAG